MAAQERRKAKDIIVPLAVALGGLLLLATLLLVALSHGKERICLRPLCKNNLKQIGLALHIYAADYGGWFPIGPPGTDNSYALGMLIYGGGNYLSDPEVLLCSSSGDRLAASRISRGRLAERGGLRPSSTSYDYFAGLKRDAPPHFMVAFDKAPHHHDGGRNVLFVDGHVEFLSEKDFEKRLSEQRSSRRLVEAYVRAAEGASAPKP